MRKTERERERERERDLPRYGSLIKRNFHSVLTIEATGQKIKQG